MNPIVDKMLSSAGSTGKYQKTMLAVILGISLMSSLVSVSLPYLEQPPLIDYVDAKGKKHERIELTDEICSSGRKYEIVHIPLDSIIAERDLYCDKKARSELSVFYNAGSFISMFVRIFGTESMGRKDLICISLLIYLIFGLGSMLKTGFTVNLLMFLIIGVFDQTAIAIAQIYLFEVISADSRTWYGTILNLIYSVAAFLFIFVYQTVGYWRVAMAINLVITGVSLFSFYFLAAESPRYYLKTGETSKFIESVDFIKKFNGKDDQDNKEDTEMEQLERRDSLNSEIQRLKDHERPSSEFQGMLSSPRILLYFGAISVNIFYANFSYFSLGLNVKNLAGNIYTNGYLMYGIELVSYFLAGLTMRSIYLRRKGSFILFSCISLLFSALSLFVKEDSSAFTWFNILNRAACNACWLIIVILNNEIFPTSVRVSASAWSGLLSNIGLMVAPIMVEYSNTWLQLILLGTNILSMGCAILLEETEGKTLKEFTD